MAATATCGGDDDDDGGNACSPCRRRCRHQIGAIIINVRIMVMIVCCKYKSVKLVSSLTLSETTIGDNSKTMSKVDQVVADACPEFRCDDDDEDDDDDNDGDDDDDDDGDM